MIRRLVISSIVSEKANKHEGTYESVNGIVFHQNLIETADWRKEDNGVHIIKERNPSSYT